MPLKEKLTTVSVAKNGQRIGQLFTFALIGVSGHHAVMTANKTGVPLLYGAGTCVAGLFIALFMSRLRRSFVGRLLWRILLVAVYSIACLLTLSDVQAHSWYNRCSVATAAFLCGLVLGTWILTRIGKARDLPQIQPTARQTESGLWRLAYTSGVVFLASILLSEWVALDLQSAILWGAIICILIINGIGFVVLWIQK